MQKLKSEEEDGATIALKRAKARERKKLIENPAVDISDNIAKPFV